MTTCVILRAKAWTPRYSEGLAFSQINEHSILPAFKKNGAYPVVSDHAQLIVKLNGRKLDYPVFLIGGYALP